MKNYCLGIITQDTANYAPSLREVRFRPKASSDIRLKTSGDVVIHPKVDESNGLLKRNSSLVRDCINIVVNYLI